MEGVLRREPVIRRDRGNQRRQILLLPTTHRRLVRPASCCVLYSVATSTKHESRNAEGQHKLKARAVTVDGEIEGANAVSAQRICTALHDYGCRTVDIDCLGNNLNESKRKQENGEVDKLAEI